MRHPAVHLVALAIILFVFSGVAEAAPTSATALEVAQPLVVPAHSTEDAAQDLPTVLSAFDIILVVVAATGLVILWKRRMLPIPKSMLEHGPPLSVAMFFALGLMLAQPIGAALAVQWRGIADPSAASFEDSTVVRAGAYVLAFLVYGVFAAIHSNKQQPSETGRMGVIRASMFGAAILLIAWPLTALTGDVAAAIIQAVSGEAQHPIAHDLLKQVVERPFDGWTFLTIVLVVVGAPIIEEFLHRGLILPGLCRAGIGPWIAIVFSAAFFAFLHWTIAAPNAVVALFVFGIALGWCRLRTGNLAAPIMLHALFNLGNVVVALALFDETAAASATMAAP